MSADLDKKKVYLTHFSDKCLFPAPLSQQQLCLSVHISVCRQLLTVSCFALISVYSSEGEKVEFLKSVLAEKECKWVGPLSGVRNFVVGRRWNAATC